MEVQEEHIWDLDNVTVKHGIAKFLEKAINSSYRRDDLPPYIQRVELATKGAIWDTGAMQYYDMQSNAWYQWTPTNFKHAMLMLGAKISVKPPMYCKYWQSGNSCTHRNCLMEHSTLTKDKKQAECEDITIEKLRMNRRETSQKRPKYQKYHAE